MPQDSDARSASHARQEAIIDSYLFVCGMVRAALRTHLGAQHTLQRHRQDVLALQESLHLHQQIFAPVDFANMQQGINEMLHHLSTSLFSLSDPIREDVYIDVKSFTQTGRRGRPKINLDPTFLEQALSLRQPTGIAREVKVSARTVRRRALEFGLREPGQPVYTTYVDVNGTRIRQYSADQPPARLNSLTEGQLDHLLADTLTRFPEFGRSLSTGHFRSQGYQVSRLQLRQAYLRVQGGPAIVGHRRLRRREYNVAGPNSLWHHDGQHGLIRYSIVVHAMIDGKSRLVVGARASNNNRSETVLELFQEAIRQYGRPSRVRGDFGGENVKVAEDQEATRGRGTYIWGRSIHNTRIERLWVDYADGVKRKWWTFFEQLESHHGLDISRDSHMWLLHLLFLPALNEDISMWVEAWNNHPMRLPRGERTGRSPRDQFFFGMVQHGPRGLDALDPVDDPQNYGIDWEELGDPRIRQSQQDNTLAEIRPGSTSQVTVEPPYGDVDEQFTAELLRQLGLAVDLASPDMDVRMNTWIQALAIVEHMAN